MRTGRKWRGFDRRRVVSFRTKRRRLWEDAWRSRDGHRTILGGEEEEEELVMVRGGIEDFLVLVFVILREMVLGGRKELQ